MEPLVVAIYFYFYLVCVYHSRRVHFVSTPSSLMHDKIVKCTVKIYTKVLNHACLLCHVMAFDKCNKSRLLLLKKNLKNQKP
jgi:hypothetical protein